MLGAHREPVLDSAPEPAHCGVSNGGIRATRPGPAKGEPDLKRLGLLLSLLVLASTATTAVASSVHLKGGKNAEPSFTDGGLLLSASGELSGLGNGDVVVAISATGNVTSTCTNNGGNAAPGQNPAPITLTGTQVIPESEIKNGTTPFNVSTTSAPATIAGAPDCPNPNWTESIDDVAFTNATINVYQPAGTLVLTITCTINPPSSDGAVPGGSVSCTQSQP